MKTKTKTVAVANHGGAMEPETIKNGARLKSLITSRGNLITKALLILVFVIATLDCFSQKITEGSLDFLIGQQKLHVVFDFEDAKLQHKTEKAYLEMAGEAWAEGWETAKSSTFMAGFLEHLNKNVQTLQCGDYPDTQYQANVRILTVIRGDFPGPYLEGPGTRFVTCEVVFTKTGDSKPLAKITKLKGDSKKGNAFAPTAVRVIGTAGSNTYLTGIAFGYIGQDFGKFIAKKIK